MLFTDLINESLFANDLVGLILPMFSIFEFEPKIQSDAIVVAFYVKNKEAAEDLSVFLEKSSIEDIIDAEVSAAPDENGNYLVFIEMPRKVTTNDILRIIKIINHLCPIENWKMTGHKLNKEYDANEKNISLYLSAIHSGKLS